MTADLLACLESQTLLLNRLRQHGVLVTALTPTVQMVREAILASGLEHTICGRGPGGKACTYAKFFLLAFGEPLARTQLRRERAKANA